MIHLETFDDRAALADAAAGALGERLTGGGLLIAAGGATPVPVYERLSRLALPWTRILVTLTDERFVDPASDGSNEKMVRASLLRGQAGTATFLPLKLAGQTAAGDAHEAEIRLAPHLPAAAVILGMGSDGHVASLFPEMPELPAGLDLDGERLALGVARSGLPPFVPRITLTARALTRTGLLLLLITGEGKRALIDRIGSDENYAPPAATFLRQTLCPVRVLWSA